MSDRDYAAEMAGKPFFEEIGQVWLEKDEPTGIAQGSVFQTNRGTYMKIAKAQTLQGDLVNAVDLDDGRPVHIPDDCKVIPRPDAKTVLGGEGSGGAG